MPAIIITAKNYKREIKRCKTPVLLSFCNVSSFLRLTTDMLHDEMRGKIKVGVVDADNITLMDEYNVRFLPTTLLIKNNIVTDRIIGDTPLFKQILSIGF